MRRLACLSVLAAALGASPANSQETVFLSGRSQGVADVLVGTAGLAQAPVVAPGSFFSAGFVAAEGEISPIGRLVELISPTVVSRVPPQIHPHDRVYMTLAGRGVVVGERLQLLRQAGAVVPYGRIFLPTGIARVVALEQGLATVEIEGLYDRVAIGDVAVAMPEFRVPMGVLPLSAGGLTGEVLAIAGPQPLAGTEDLAFLNLGTASGVIEGDEFVVFIPASIAPWGGRPEIEVARVQVVRAGRLTSTVRVVALEHPALEPGLPVRLVAKMP